MGRKHFNNYDITLVITHRCNAKCKMCSSHQNPSCIEEELTLSDLLRIPDSSFVQITGGEPFVRADLERIVDILSTKTKRLMIITNGYFTDELVSLCRKYPKLAVRISIDGDRNTHNEIRGIAIYDKAVNSLNELVKLGIKDLGISFTLQESNYTQLIPMYEFALERNVDFGVNIIHNSYYFYKRNNSLESVENIKAELKKLVELQLESTRKKDWARAFFNDMSINYINGMLMPVKCDAGRSSYTIECNGDVLPCNMTPIPWVMGNIRESLWDDIIGSNEACDVIEKCRNCSRNCWSVCNVQSALKKKIWVPGSWLLKMKICKQMKNKKH